MTYPLLLDAGRAPMIGAYYFFRGDLEKARHELDLLAKTGVNHLWLFIDDYFRRDDPRALQEFEAFIDLLSLNNLYFAPVIGQFISIKDHPEIRIMMSDGTFSEDPRFWNMGCFRQPKNLEWAKSEALSFLALYRNHERLVRINGQVMMSFVHEAYYRTDTPEMGGNTMRPNCYCAYCVQSFRDHLSSGYESIEEYNLRHHQKIESWNEAQPPKGPEPDSLLWLEWIDHHAQAIPDFLRELIKAAREETPLLATHECNDFYPGSWQTVLTGNDIWRMAAEIDLGHEDMYPLEFDQQYQIYIYALMKDIMRSAMGFDRPYTGNGQAFTPWVVEARLPKNSLMEQVYTSIIHGVSGLVWWLGKDLDLWRQMEEANHFLRRWLPEIQLMKAERAKVALLYSYTSLALAQNDWHTLDLQLIYMALRQLGIPVDIVSEGQVALGILVKRRYQLVIMPGVSATPSATRGAVEEFITEGGALIADSAETVWEQFAPPVEFCSKSLKRPRFYQSKESPELFIPVESKITGCPVVDGLGEGEKLALFDTGQPAVVRWPKGAGQVIGIGSLLGVDFANYLGHIHLNQMFPFLIRMNGDAREFLLRLCNRCGVTPIARADRSEVEWGVFETENNRRLCFVVNHLPEPVLTELRFLEAGRLLEGSSDRVSPCSAEEGLTVQVELAPLGGAWFVYQR